MGSGHPHSLKSSDAKIASINVKGKTNVKHGICAVTDLGSIRLQRTNIFAVTQKGGKMSTKLVRYKDVCVALVPMIADMLQKGDVKPAIDTLNALGALEDADPAKEIKECCKANEH